MVSAKGGKRPLILALTVSWDADTGPHYRRARSEAARRADYAPITPAGTGFWITRLPGVFPVSPEGRPKFHGGKRQGFRPSLIGGLARTDYVRAGNGVTLNVDRGFLRHICGWPAAKRLPIAGARFVVCAG